MSDYPDIIDLQSWMVNSTIKDVQQAWDASKYLSDPYEFWIKVWKSQGSPNVTE